MRRFWQATGFYILKGILYAVSLLPLWLLYLKADFIRVIIYYVIGYRKKVVRENLRRSFPLKSSQELRQIERKYYRHLADLLVENIWILTASGKEIQQHCTFENIAVLDDFANQNKDVITLMGHLGNWEWAGLSMSATGKHKLRALYRPLSNPYFNGLFLNLRTRFGGEMIPMNQIARKMMEESEKAVCTTFIADQTPAPESAVWVEFLSQDTPFFAGYASFAIKKNLPVVMAVMKKQKRGRYTIRLERIAEPGEIKSKEELVRRFAKNLEESILEQPEYWLWSHRRWKHKRKT